MSLRTCPQRDDLLEYALGHTSPEVHQAVEEHLAKCDDCQAVLADSAGDDDSLVAALRRPAAPPLFSDDPAYQAGLEKVLELPRAQPLIPVPVPERLGTYRLLERLGSGGMGVVYKALHVPLNRTVAVKLVHPDRVRDRAAVARFQREMQAVAAIEHPGIVRAHDAGEIDGIHFLVMEYIDGIDLAELVRLDGPLPVADACAYVGAAAAALQHAHELGLVHRDIKPSNLILTAAGPGNKRTVKVLDLGLALLSNDERAVAGGLTDTGMLVGTSDYMAPEQWLDPRTADRRSDVYSLGCTLYYLLAGQAPFAGPEVDTVGKKMQAHTLRTPPPIAKFRPDVPAALSQLLDRMLAKDPEQRLATMAQVADALAPLSEPGAASGLVEPQAPRRRSRIFRFAAVAMTIVAITAALSGVVIRIKDKSGRETVLQVPDAASVEVETDGKSVAVVHTAESAKEAKGAPIAEKPTSPAVPIEKTPRKAQRKPGDNAGTFSPTLGGGMPAPGRTVDVKRMFLAGQLPGNARVPPPSRPVPESGWSNAVTGKFPTSASDLEPPSSEIPSGAPLSPTALVPEPATIPRVRSWTIEATGHRGIVTKLAFHPDGKTLATCGADGTIRLWNTETGAIERILIGHKGVINAICWSRDGRLFSAGGEGNVRFWEARSGRLLRVSEPLFGSATDVSCSPDGTHVACTAPRFKYRVLSTESGKRDGRAFEPIYPVNGPTSISWSPDGHVLVNGLDDGGIELVDAKTGERTMAEFLGGHVGRIRCLRWSPDGRYILSSSADKTVRIWDPRTGATVRGFHEHTKEVSSVAWSPKGDRIAAGSFDSTISVWDLAGKRHAVFSYGDDVYSIDWSPDGRLIACVGRDQDIRLLDAETGAVKLSIPVNRSIVYDAKWSPDGSRLACGQRSGEIRFWDMKELKIDRTSYGPGTFVTSVAWSPKGDSLASATDSGVQVRDVNWSKPSGEILTLHTGTVHDVSFAPDGKTLVTAGADGLVLEVRQPPPQPPRGLPLSGHRGAVLAVAHAADGRAIATGGADHTVRLWNALNRAQMEVLRRHSGVVRAVAWSPDGQTVASGGDDRATLLWHAESGRELWRFEQWGDDVRSLAWSPDGQWLAVGRQQAVFIHEPKTGSVVRELRLAGSWGGGFGVSWSPDGKLLAIYDVAMGTIRFYDVRLDRLCATLFSQKNGGFIGRTGHHRLSAEATKHIVYIILTDDGQQEVLPPDEFAKRFGFKNDPAQVILAPP